MIDALIVGCVVFGLWLWFVVLCGEVLYVVLWVVGVLHMLMIYYDGLVVFIVVCSGGVGLVSGCWGC